MHHFLKFQLKEDFCGHCLLRVIFFTANLSLFGFQAGGKAGKDSKAKAKAVSRSARAGLQVSSRFQREKMLQGFCWKPICVPLVCTLRSSFCTVSSRSYSQTFEEPND